MEFKEILAISGQSGLYKFVAQSKNGIIVESLDNGARINASGSSKVSALAEIAIFTENEDLPLGVVFEKIFVAKEGKETISHKSTPEQMTSFFAEVLPDYDRQRVHVSDIKKVINWYNTMVRSGMTEFKIEEEVEDASDDNSEAKAKPAAKSAATAAGAKPAAKAKAASGKGKTTAAPAMKTKNKGMVKM